MPKRLESTAPLGAQRDKPQVDEPPLSAKGGRIHGLDEDEDLPLDEDQPIQTEVPVHCKKWIDYTSKYGLGYVLSNGVVGVFFNDATKIILDQDGAKFHYFERKAKEDIHI